MQKGSGKRYLDREASPHASVLEALQKGAGKRYLRYLWLVLVVVIAAGAVVGYQMYQLLQATQREAEGQDQFDKQLDRVNLAIGGGKPRDSAKPDKAEQPTKPTELERRGELTRPVAAAILNEYLAKPSVSGIGFREGGIDRAVADGIMKNDWHPGDFGGARYSFTDKGLQLADGCIADAKELVIGGFGGRKTLQLKAAIGQTVDEVTGITMDGPMPTVEFTTSYAFPSNMTPFKNYVFTGEKKAVVFRKYDDGWRVRE